MRLVVLGGGGFRVPLVYRALLSRPALGVRELVLCDPDAARLAVIGAVLAAEGEGGPAVRTETDLERALRDADVVFSAIRVGGAAARARDERRALDAGALGQETVGLAGIAYGLRTVPVALDIARVVTDVAPHAWVINFTNPAGMITEALRPVLGARVIGVCDSPNGLIARVCRVFGVPVDAVRADYAGINHCGWLRSLRLAHRDLLAELLSSDALIESFEEGRLFGARALRALGCVPNEYLHFYYAAAELTERLRAGRTRGEILAGEQGEFYAAAGRDPDAAAELWAAALHRRESTYLAETRSLTQQRDRRDLVGGGYQDVAIDLITALTSGEPATLIVNAPNARPPATAGPDGRDDAAMAPAIPGLPADMVVETASRIDGTGATALPAAPPDLHQLGLICAVRAAERAAIDAVRTGDRATAYRALLTHPLCGSPAAAARMLDGLLADEPALAALLR